MSTIYRTQHSKHTGKESSVHLEPLWLAYRDQCYAREEEIKRNTPGLYRAMRRGALLLDSDINILRAIESDTRDAFDRWFSAAIDLDEEMSTDFAVDAANADIDAWIERTNEAASNADETWFPEAPIRSPTP